MNNTIIKLAKIKEKKVYIMQGNKYFLADDSILLVSGDADSEGVVLICGDLVRYVSSTQIDASFIIAQLVKCIDSIIKISDNSKYVIGAEAVVFGKMASMSDATTELKKIKKDISEHKLI